MMTLGILAAQAGAMAMSLHASVTVDAETITIPNTVNNGDIAVLWDAAAAAFDLTAYIRNISGWTKEISVNNDGGTAGAGRYLLNQVYFKILSTSDRNVVVTGTNADPSTGVRRKILAIFRPTAPAASYRFRGYAGVNSSGDPAAQSILASGGEPDHVAFGLYRSGSTVSTRSMSPSATAEIANGTTTYMKYLIATSAGDVSIDTGDNGVNNYLAGFWLEAYP